MEGERSINDVICEMFHKRRDLWNSEKVVKVVNTLGKTNYPQII